MQFGLSVFSTSTALALLPIYTMWVLRTILEQNYFPWEDWQKANRISCWQTLIRTVYLNQRGIITLRGMPAHCWKILTSAQFCRRPPDPGAWSYAVGWWGWSGQSDCLQRFLCSSLKLFIVVPFESGTALLKDKADEDYPSWNRALLARPWNPSSQLVTHLGTSSVCWQERWRVTAATDQN